jgi:hypothetical protein
VPESEVKAKPWTMKLTALKIGCTKWIVIDGVVSEKKKNIVVDDEMTATILEIEVWTAMGGHGLRRQHRELPKEVDLIQKIVAA